MQTCQPLKFIDLEYEITPPTALYCIQFIFIAGQIYRWTSRFLCPTHSQSTVRKLVIPHTVVTAFFYTCSEYLMEVGAIFPSEGIPTKERQTKTANRLSKRNREKSAIKFSKSQFKLRKPANSFKKITFLAYGTYSLRIPLFPLHALRWFDVHFVSLHFFPVGAQNGSSTLQLKIIQIWVRLRSQRVYSVPCET